MSEEQNTEEGAPLLWEIRGHVAILTLNRPKAMNSWDMEMMNEHRRLLTEFEEDDNLRVLIYTGAGRAFSTGINIRKEPDFLYLTPKERTSKWITPNSIKLNKPTIAAINGYALGGGLELALGCDIRIMAASAKVGLPEVKLGALPGGGGTQWLPRLIGYGDAMMMMLSGEPIDATEALRLRLVQKVVADDDLLIEALKLANAIAENGKTAVRLTKEVALLGLNAPLADALWLEEIYFARNRVDAADEIKERLEAFQNAKKKK